MLSTLLNRDCIITRRSSSGSTDAYGNVIPGEEEVETVCELQQQRRDEQDDQGETSDTYWLLVLPKQTAIHTGDTVTVDSERYEVHGDPERKRNPRTRVFSHVEATLRRTGGSGDEVGS